MRSRDMNIENLPATRRKVPNSREQSCRRFRLTHRLIGAGSSVLRTPEHPIHTSMISAKSQRCRLGSLVLFAYTTRLPMRTTGVRRSRPPTATSPLYFCIVFTSQSSPSSSPSPLVAQLPRTDHSRPFSPPARPSLSDISAGERAPWTSWKV
jgi:hypothetical protein